MLLWSNTKYMRISKLMKLQLTSLPQTCCRPFERSTTWGDFSRIWVHNWLSATLREDRVWANFVTFGQGSWRKKKPVLLLSIQQKLYHHCITNWHFPTVYDLHEHHRNSPLCRITSFWLDAEVLHNVPSMRLHGYFSWVKHYSPHSEWLFSEARK